MDKLNKKKGISLIVLVITIIVMIVLATAIILSLQSSGIIGRANEAKSKTDISNAKQVVAMAEAEWKLDEEKIKEKDSTIQKFNDYANKKLIEAGYKTEGNGGISLSESGAINTIYIDSKGKQAIIPEGFTVSSVSTEKTIEDGLVIKDKKGNEFVWIPVEVPNGKSFSQVFKTTTTYDGTITSPNDYMEPFTGTTPEGEEVSDVKDLTGEHAEYTKMRESVEKNGGFYIGRYEAGSLTERTGNNDGTTELVVQKNKHPYRYVGWGTSMTDVTSDIGTQGKGAVELSREMYKNSTSVVSTLCYSVQWDAALQYMYKTNPEFTTTATGNGHCATGDDWNPIPGVVQEPILTGSNDDYAKNNIYDMAGNVAEWTMESEYSYNRVHRGGSYIDPISAVYASRRSSYYPNTTQSPSYGFRVALYIK